MATRPRLLIITPDFPPSRGGIQVLVHRLATGLSGFETSVIALDCAGATRFDEQRTLAVRRVSAPRHVGGGRAVLLNIAALRYALRFRPHMILSAHIVTSPAAATLRRLLGARTVQYFYAEEISAKPILAEFAAREADEAIAISAYTAGLIAASGGSTPSIRVIPPGVDIPSDPAPIAADRPTVLTIARMQERYKGHDVLVRALPLVLAKVLDAQWVVIGDGSLRPGLEHLARSYGLTEAVSFLGAVSDQERDRWLARADLLAMPSRLPAGGLAGEGFGIVYLEAGAYGKPVVAGDVGGTVDAVSDGENGLLVDPTDSLAVAEAITRLLLDCDLARRLGSAGRQRAQNYAWPVIVERVEAVLLEQLAAARGAGGVRRGSRDSARSTA